MASRHLVGLTSALAVVMCASVAAIQVANPQMRSSCKFVYTAPDGSKSVTFDSASLCSTTDYILTDVKGHNYYAQICGTAKHNCLPGASDDCVWTLYGRAAGPTDQPSDNVWWRG